MQEFLTNQISEPTRLYDNTCDNVYITYSNTMTITIMTKTIR